MHDIRAALAAGPDASPIATKKKKRLAGDGPTLTAIAIPREETRRTNQRREERRKDLVDSATLFLRRRRHEVAVSNVSSWGAMVDSPLEPRIGERVEIQFPECNRTAGFVRWIREGRIGIEFVEETTIIASAEVRETIDAAEESGDAEEIEVPRLPVAREPRQPLVWSGTLYWSFEAFTVRLRNISRDGAMLECERELEPGAQVRLNLAEAGTIAGEVRWAEGGQLGVRFDDRFDLRLLALAKASLAAPAVPSVDEQRAIKKDTGRIAGYWSRLR